MTPSSGRRFDDRDDKMHHRDLRFGILPAGEISLACEIFRACVMLRACAACSLLAGCSQGVLDPQGPVGADEKVILFDATTIMLAVVIPVIICTLAFAWWFRARNKRARRLPDWEYSGRIEFVTWSIPAMIVMFLGGIAWIGSHDLDPRKALGSAKPVEIEVISLDWKWLFIYPRERVATVNELVLPVNTPVHFKLTSASVMNSFFVPQLGSQIYTMAGMTTQLNLLASNAGTYAGLSAQFSGDGFSDMRFDVKAVPEDEYEEWLRSTRAGTEYLDAVRYAQLAAPSGPDPPHTFGQVTPGMFDSIVHNHGAPIGSSPSSAFTNGRSP
jgi:cytochrome o ubiquinol oxidase subunit 2